MVNRTPNTRQEQDDAYKPGALQKHEEEAAGGAPMQEHTQGSEKADGSSTATKLASAVQHAEAAPWQVKLAATAASAATKSSFLKKLGPAAGIIVTIAAVVIFIAAIAGQTLLFIQSKALLGAALNVAAPALTLTSQKMLAYKLNSVKNAFDQSSEGKCNLKCKFGTIDDTMLRNLRANGFTVETGDKKFGGRYVIKSLTFPGEKVAITTGEGMTKAIDDPRLAAMFNKVFNSKTAYFMNSKFGSTLRRLGLDKIPKVTGETKEKVIASWRKAVGLPGDSAAASPDAKKAAQEKARNGRLKPAFDAIGKAQARVAGGAANAIAGACTGYNAAKGVTYAIKAAKIAAATAVAMIFLNLADQQAAGAEVSPETVEVVANQYTQTDTRKEIVNADGSTSPNEYYGKSGMDADVLDATINNGDVGTLSTQDERSSMSPVGGISKALSDITSLLLVGGATLLVAHGICVAAPVAGTVLQCADELLLIIATVVETGGLGAVGGAAICAAKIAVSMVVMGTLLSALITSGSDSLVQDDLTEFSEETVGPPNGVMLHNGTSRIYTNAAYNYGLSAASPEEIKQYAIDTAPIQQHIAAVDRYEAQATPFDVNNQYSFLGSIAKSLNITAFSKNASSFMSSVGMIGSIIPKSFATLTAGVNAETGIVDAEKKAARFSHCTDAALNTLGVGCDSYGNETATMTAAEMNADINSVLDYMVTNKYVNDNTGKPQGDYKRFVDNCSNRVDPMGETTAAIDNILVDDYEWKIGAKCVEKSDQLSKFRSFTIQYAAYETMDKKKNPKGEDDIDGTKQELAQEIIGSPNVTYNNGDNPGFDIRDQIAAIADGSSDGNTAPCQVNINILKIIVALMDKHTIVISDINRDCVNSTLDNTSSAHHKGNAIDIATFDGVNASSPKLLEILEIATKYMPTNAVIGLVADKDGKVCRLSGVAPLYNGFTVFDDPGSCGHLHIGMDSSSDPEYPTDA